MGEYFILIGIMMIGIYAGMALMLFPGIVISIAWSMAIYLLLDKGMSPMEALMHSNKMTYGYKWNILLSIVAFSIIFMLIFFILKIISIVLASIIAILMTILFLPIVWGMYAYIYAELQKRTYQN